MQQTISYTFNNSNCKEIFYEKNKDYGSAWRILRISSLTDQYLSRLKEFVDRTKSIQK